MKFFLLVFSLLIFGCGLKNNEWKNLIINNSLEGWHIFQDDGTKDGWYVENQILIFDAISDLESGKGDSSLLSNKEYMSFEIEFEWKIEKGGNSGFMWGVKEDSKYKYPYQTGPEIQIIDIAIYNKPNEVLGGEIELNNVLADLDEKKHYLGAVYDMYSPKQIKLYNSAGSWNKYYIKIDQKNNLGQVKLNDKLINEFELNGDVWDEMYLNSKFNDSESEESEYLGERRWYDFAKFKKGHICFQDHPGKAYFKNIRIKELN
ncbi:MAG: DUF1080 domain-containing protein [Flavobacteriaceae bacterium]